MDDHGGGTYLEDFLLSLEILPNSIRRECELLKELDKEVIETNRELAQLEATHLDHLRRLKADGRLIFMSTKQPAGGLDAVSLEFGSQSLGWSIQAVRAAPSHAPGNGSDSGPNLLSDEDVEKVLQECQSITREREVLKDRAALKLSEKKAIAQNLIHILDQFGNKLDADLTSFEQDLKQSSDYEVPTGWPPNTEVAFRLALDLSDKTLILGQVVQFRSEINSYEIVDVDDQQKYIVQDTHVLPLGQADGQKRIVRGETLYALYPDTTIFYPAVVIQPARENAVTSEPMLTMQFLGDEDVTGTIPMRFIPVRCVVRAPQFL